MKPKVYIETTIISYLTAWRSPQLVMAANQETTRSWWDDERHNFDLFVSEAVIQEASAGDAAAVQRRLAAIQELSELPITDEARQLAKELVDNTPLPEKARVDAVHIATATVNGMDYLLTWNCRHIANATLRDAMDAICQSAGYEMPIICTPLELIAESRND
jgi:predicted nucleic acid-binding protein